jgi:AsmA family protein
MPQQQKRSIRRIARGFGFALAGLLALVLPAAGAGTIWLARADLKPFVEREATEALGRQVTLASFQVRWGDPLGIEFTDLAIANAPWGSKPEMVRIGRFSALLDVRPLLDGVLRYQRLRIADATIVLERDPDGIGNWTFDGRADGFGIVPKNRTQFPTLIDFIGERGLITYRTRSGNVLAIKLDRVAIFSPGEETPARLLAKGAYNDVAARLDATTESFAALRDSSMPFGARFTLAGKDTDIAFNGTLREPLDFEGARGELSIDGRTLDDILGAIGVDRTADLPLSIAGVLARDGNRWALAAAKGQSQHSDFSGDFAVNEGGPGEPDDIALDLDFGTLDVDGAAAAFGGGKRATELAAIPLHPQGLAAVNATAELTALNARIAGRKLHSVALRGRLAGGDVTLKELSLGLAGGTLRLDGTLQGDGEHGRLALKALLSKADIGRIARELGATGTELRGRLDGAAAASMTGPTFGAALKRSEGAAVLLLRDGAIARDLIEQLSSDLRSLFRERQGSVPVSCLLGVATVKNGIGVLSPLRLKSREAIATGAGKIDLVADRLDLTIRTERDSTNFFALDIPVRVSGPLDRLSAKPLAAGDEADMGQPAAIADKLPPDLHRLAGSSACRD